MNEIKNNETAVKVVFESAEVEVITFDAKEDIICTSPVSGIKKALQLSDLHIFGNEE